MHTQHPLIQRMLRRNGRQSQQCTSTRNICFLQESLQLLLCISQLNPLTNQHKWLLSRIDQIGCMLKLHAICIRNRIITTDKIQIYRFVINHFYLCILGKVKHNWSRSTTLGNIKSTSNCPSNIFCSTDLITPLTNRLSDAYQINFLKSIRSQHGSGCLTCNHHNRGTINHRISYACNRIGCTRSTGYQAYTYLTRNTGKPLGRMSRSLFVTNQDMIQLVTMSI